MIQNKPKTNKIRPNNKYNATEVSTKSRKTKQSMTKEL